MVNPRLKLCMSAIKPNNGDITTPTKKLRVKYIPNSVDIDSFGAISDKNASEICRRPGYSAPTA